MSKEWCNTEDYTGFDAHYADRSRFDYMEINDKVIFVCEDCRYELETKGN